MCIKYNDKSSICATYIHIIMYRSEIHMYINESVICIYIYVEESLYMHVCIYVDTSIYYYIISLYAT